MSLLSTALSTSRFVGQYIFFNKIGSVCFGGRRHSISISTFHSTVPVPASLCLLPGITTEFLTGTNQEQVSTTQNYCTALHCTALHCTSLHCTIPKYVRNYRSFNILHVVQVQVILGEDYISYRSALEVLALELLSERRLARCLAFSLKCNKDENTSRFLPRNPNIDLTLEARNREEFTVNFCWTKQYKDSTTPFCQRLLNAYMRKLEEQGEEGEARRMQ